MVSEKRSRLAQLESLPDEILLEIISFLEPKDIIKLQAQSKRLKNLCRDNNFWRNRCLLESSFLDGINVRRGLRYHPGDGPSNDPLLSAALAFQESSSNGADAPEPSLPVNFSWSSPRALEAEKKRIAANWDPTFENERIYWYDEYIQRHGPISVNWLEQPHAKNGSLKDAVEVKGVAVWQPRREGRELFAVSPLENGSVCLWDVKGTRSKRGSIFSKSAPGLLFDGAGAGTKPQMASDGATECVTVDSDRNRAFIATDSRLTEVDLETLQVVGNHSYEWVITALSEARPNVPISVGTEHGIHLHDPRMRSGNTIGDAGQRIDVFDRAGLDSLRPIPPTWQSKKMQQVSLAQPGPLSVHHPERAGSREASDDIFICGRFSSILHYDRRMFPAVRGSIHSGGRLCSLASLPYPFSTLNSELRRRGELSQAQVDEIKGTPGGQTLIACGEYNTKGSLEVYGLAAAAAQDSESTPPSRDKTGGCALQQNSTMKNRQTASKSKLLSVINHGSRILVSDGQGCLKWVERDGFTEVRSHTIGHAGKPDAPSLFGSTTPSGGGEIARKLLSTQTTATNGGGAEPLANDDDVLFWTGERLGLVGFSNAPAFGEDDFKEDSGSGNAKTPEEVATEDEEQRYSEGMRHALSRQADDVRFVRYLGSGGC